MQKVTDQSTQRNVKVKKDAGSSECLCGRWDNDYPDVPLRLRTVHNRIQETQYPFDAFLR